MGKIRRPGRALTRTYIKVKASKGKPFQARVIDVRIGTDIKCSGNSIDQALKCAKHQAIKERQK